MKIAIPIAAYEIGTTGEYSKRAFQQLGHQVDILSQWDFYRELKADSYDLYFCVDSGGPLNLTDIEIATHPNMKKVCFWMIDYRRGKTLKNPTDLSTCKIINAAGGWVFQSQLEDVEDCFANKINRVSWLPLAADPDVWNNEPKQEKIYDIGFVGNVWDATRQQVLDQLAKRYRLGFLGHGVALMNAGATVLRGSKVGFNISSFYGEPVAYDVNMRVFETLSCGIPLVTNFVPSINRLFSPNSPFIWDYTSLDQLYRIVDEALTSADEKSGDLARQYILESATYKIRMEHALDTLKYRGVIQ